MIKQHVPVWAIRTTCRRRVLSEMELDEVHVRLAVLPRKYLARLAQQTV